MATVNPKLCDQCGAQFTRAHDLKRHLQRKHTNTVVSYICEICEEIFPNVAAITNHRVEAHKPDTQNGYKVVNKSLKGVACLYEKVLSVKSIEEVFVDNDDIKGILQYETGVKRVIKANIDVQATFIQYDFSGEICDSVTITLRSKSYTLLRSSDIDEFISTCQAEIVTRANDFTTQGSGWVLQCILKQHISIAKAKSLIGGCNAKSFNIDKRLLKYTHNPVDNENGCFYTCIATALLEEENINYKNDIITAEEHIMHYIDNNINKIGDCDTIHVNQISHFLKINKHLNIGINVVLCEGDEGDELTPVFCSKRDTTNQMRISLVLVYEPNSVIGHFLLITDFNNFMKTSYIDSSGFTQYKKLWYCFNCLCGFHLRTTLDEHVKLCDAHETQKILLPPPGEMLFFKDYEKTYLAPLIGFLDFESFLSDTEKCQKCLDSDCCHKTTTLNEHIPFSWSLVIIDINNDILVQESYVGLDCGEKLVEYLLKHEEYLVAKVKTERPMSKLTEQQTREYNLNNTCVICFREISHYSDKRHHHHHYTGELIGPAHNACNVNCYKPSDIPIYVHNLGSYDAMFLIQALSKIESINSINERVALDKDETVKAIKKIKIKVLPHNTERIRTMTINSFKMLDSMDLFHAGLASLVDDLHASKHKFPLLKKSGIYKTKQQRKLLLCKGVYPYSFGKKIEDLVSKRKIPHKRYFYSDIGAEAISDDLYEHAKTVFKTFKMKNMLEYSQLYCLLDVYLLAECVTHFRQVIYQASKLDCSAFLSAAHLAFNMFLKITKTELDLLSDPDQVSFIQDNIRGGLSFINMRYAEATDTKKIIYIDQNNLYGYSQCQLLPHSQYRWLSEEEKKSIDWKTINTTDVDGYIVECTLVYPEHLHKAHNDFPLAPEQMDISYDDLSPYSQG